MAKTTDDGYEALKERIAEPHHYDVPCIERFEEADLLDSFAEWYADATQQNHWSASKPPYRFHAETQLEIRHRAGVEHARDSEGCDEQANRE